MTNSCRLFATEYSRNYIKRKSTPVESFIPRDYFAERIEEGEIDPRVASIPTKLDEAAEQLIHKHALDYQRSVYQVSYKDHWALAAKKETEKDKSKSKDKESGFETQLLAYIRNLYFDPHDEQILAPPVTTKRKNRFIFNLADQRKTPISSRRPISPPSKHIIGPYIFFNDC